MKTAQLERCIYFKLHAFEWRGKLKRNSLNQNAIMALNFWRVLVVIVLKTIKGPLDNRFQGWGQECIKCILKKWWMDNSPCFVWGHGTPGPPMTALALDLVLASCQTLAWSPALTSSLSPALTGHRCWLSSGTFLPFSSEEELHSQVNKTSERAQNFDQPYIQKTV